MIRAVIDTNVVISALYRGGIPGTVLALASHGEIRMVVSPFLLKELADTLREEKFSKSPAWIHKRIAHLRTFATVVHPRITFSVIADDDDNRVLECAVTGRAHFIITGDRDLLRLESFRGIHILTPAQFLYQLGR